MKKSLKCLIIVLFGLLICWFGTDCRAQKDYIVQKGGMKIYGEILNSNPASFASQIRFKTKNSIAKTLYPGNILSWKRGQRKYISTTFRISKKKQYPVFMELKAGENGPVRLLEFYNSYGEYGFTQTFLEKEGLKTEPNTFGFRKQMKNYFADEPEAVAAIQSGRYKAKQLAELVTFYNQLKKGARPVPVQEETAIAQSNISEITENNSEQTTDSNWDIDDLLLSMEAAEKKYMDRMKSSTKDIQDKDLRKIIINHRIGSNFFEQKQYDKALPYLLKALSTIAKTRKQEPLKASIQLMLTQLYSNNGKHTLAIPYNGSLLVSFEAQPTTLKAEEAFEAYKSWAIVLQNIDEDTSLEPWKNQIESHTRDWKVALGEDAIDHAINTAKIAHYNYALLSFKKAASFLSPKKIHQKINLNLAIGELFFEAGLYDQSLTYYQDALSSMQDNFGEDYPQIPEISRKLSEIYLAAELYTEALEYIDKADRANTKEQVSIDASLLKNINKVAFPFELLYSITTKAIVQYRQLGKSATEAQLQKILTHYAIATQLLHQLRNTYKKEGAKYRLANVTHRFSQHAILICNDLYNITKRKQYLEDAFHYAELSKSAVLFETMHDLKSKKVSGIPNAQIVQENGLKSKIAYLKSEIYYEQQKGALLNQAKIDGLEAEVIKSKAAHQQLLRTFETDYPAYFQLKYDYKGIALKTLQNELNDKEIFLEYVATDSFIYVLAISKNDINSHFQTLSEKLPLRIKRMQYILKNNKVDLFQKHAPDLYRDVIEGIESFIKDKNLIIAADAELNYLPFGVLPTKASNYSKGSKGNYRSTHFLIQDHAICYNYSASIYWHNKNQLKVTAQKPIATWAPKFDQMNAVVQEKGLDVSLSELPGAQQEALDIAAMFQSQSYINQAASEQEFKNKASDYAVLHIATHGLLNDEDPLYSNLILCNQNKEDGILHAFELYNMQLKANLAVLSACNSGMGKLTKGEGVVSIARGFSYAGVPNIIMSKWPVSDWSTQQLMRSLYNNLKEGMPIDLALQQAKISYIEQNKQKDQLIAPFYWGGFVLTGSNQSIDILTQNETWTYWLAGIALLLSSGLAWWIIRKKHKV